jgi:hypothetical protein
LGGYSGAGGSINNYKWAGGNPNDFSPGAAAERGARIAMAFDAAVVAAMKPGNTALIGGFGSGVIAAANGVLPIAESTGLKVGLVWGRSVVSGADSVITKADFMASELPKIDSALAKTALGTAGLLGSAGSGAMINKAPVVTTDTTTGTPALPPIHNHFYVDGKELRFIAADQVNTAMNDLVSSISRQSG